MQVPVQVVLHGLARLDGLHELIRGLAARTCRPHARVTRCHVAVELSSRDGQEERRCSVRVTIGVPGAELVCQAEEASAQDAARSAFDAMRLQLEAHKRRACGTPRPAAPRST
jgi:ribosome-associated translation inhibitor RaiA